MTNMTIPGRLRAELLVALQSHDWERLDDALEALAEEPGGEKEAQELFRLELLPEASVEAREAFWREAMDEEQFASFAENMCMATLSRLQAGDYELGKDFSFVTREDGLRLLVANDASLDYLVGFYEPHQLASLSIILRSTNESTGRHRRRAAQINPQPDCRLAE